MNKRLFKKLENATDKWCQNNYMSYPDKHNHEWNEKFAELIVKECLEQIDKMRDGFEADNEDQQALGADWAGLAVARHFGVE